MHNCTGTIQKEESHVAKIIHFHGPEKAFGSQHTVEKEDLGRIRCLFVLKILNANCITTKTLLKALCSVNIILSLIFNLFTPISTTYSYVHLYLSEPMTDEQHSSRGTSCYNVVEKKISTSRHLCMLSVSITTP